ncbi:hypothetical protein FH039_05575 [Thermococcus indicus]|uniref:Uncharacterized protein n=1 Tax=Thermococcus indicus TaxID=2586643 RepID=A0A4Y5SLX3_9EURY|nr:hypothetical protein [Thermococcus indicus]QDA31172.1 hypothetical protein FH039_05575 [Thermococcus indicus]
MIVMGAVSVWWQIPKFEQITAKQLLQMLEETIESGRPYCPGSSKKYRKLALEKHYPGMGLKNKLRLVIQWKDGRYRIVTAFPVDK